VDKDIQRFIVRPFIVLVGIYIAGAVVETLFDLPGAAKYIFLGIGGTGFAVLYFKREITK